MPEQARYQLNSLAWLVARLRTDTPAATLPTPTTSIIIDSSNEELQAGFKDEKRLQHNAPGTADTYTPWATRASARGLKSWLLHQETFYYRPHSVGIFNSWNHADLPHDEVVRIVQASLAQMLDPAIPSRVFRQR